MLVGTLFLNPLRIVWLQHGTKEDEAKFGDNQENLDEQSTAKNFLNVARQGDLSPRHIEKGKSTIKGRNKHLKDNPSGPGCKQEEL